MIGALGALAGIVVTVWNPTNGKLLNLAFLACIAIAWLCLTALAWKWKPLRFALLILPVLLAIPFLLPGRPIDSAELRQDFLRRMDSFTVTPYRWGGENARGIDCSGLPRRSYRDALLSYGIRHGNGRAIRTYAEQWWYDASAKALGQGYRHYTSPLGISGTIQEMDYQPLLPGDLAVTDSGRHILAYSGNDRWIQAEPDIGKVATLNGHTDQNRWFEVPVTLHRWRILSEDGNSSGEILK